MRRTLIASGVWGIAVSALLAGAARAQLDPPVGPIVKTGKTLSEVEPRIAVNVANTPGDANSLFNITQPGSYYLTGNITGVDGKHGIDINVSGVTLDLNGFDMVGVPGSLDGIRTPFVGLRGLSVLNGTVRLRAFWRATVR